MAISPELFPQKSTDGAESAANFTQLAHILVVDDDPDIAEPLLDYLSHYIPVNPVISHFNDVLN